MSAIASGRLSRRGATAVSAAGIQQRVPAEAGQVPRLRAAVVRFLEHEHRGTERMVEDVALAVTEACSNVVRHAYPSGGGEIRLAAWIEPHALIVVVADDGVGLGRPSAAAGLGMGRRLIEELSRARFSDHRGTRVEMRFPYRPAGEP